MKYIVPMIVGAIIGYATNWLAIKMLFKPHYEKSFLGFKIPFTPGLIPKEKTRIAKNIGETVGEYLLSPKAISETLLSEKTNDQVKLWIKSKIIKLKEDERPIKDLLIDRSKDQFSEIICSMETSISSWIIGEIQKEKTKNIILEFIKEKLYDDNIYDRINLRLREVLGETLESEGLRVLIEEKIDEESYKISNDERILRDVLPEKVELEIEKYLDRNIEDIGDHIRKIMERPNVQYKIKESISNMVDQNISRLITSFIPAESISEKVYYAIEKYINDENSNKDMLLLIKSFIDRIMESKVSKLTPGILEKIDSMEISQYILSYIGNQENQDMIIKIIHEKIKDIDREKIMEKLSKELDIILKGDKLKSQINLFIKDIRSNFMDKPISQIISKLENNLSSIYHIIKVVFDQFIINQLPSIIEIFNISKIVEDEINKFDVEFTEKLILDIANKELKAITNLGALLGGIMGLLSPLLQML